MKIEILDWTITPQHVDIDFYVIEQGRGIEKCTPYRVGCGLAHAARVLEAIGEFEVVDIYETISGEQRITTAHWNGREEIRCGDNLYKLVEETLFPRMEDFVRNLWSVPEDRDEYIRGKEFVTA